MKMSSVIFAFIALFFLLSIRSHEGARILDEEEEEWIRRGHLLLPSLQGRTVRPPSPNGCTYIPGGGGSPCRNTISEKNFVGRLVAAPPPPPRVITDSYPRQMVQFGVATDGR
ncbi:Hypothetical predicted protein [Olea europaea subsp. europaea]|uniref:Uncharacterized protein n=1 Tax=Olea europaea subsp. europaea TaxID=158383 RepID=A0A8S0RFW9_OLEEU|nr:Hypothetical predicted protein [Olea europaea subsp. europaea]